VIWLEGLIYKGIWGMEREGCEKITVRRRDKAKVFILKYNLPLKIITHLRIFIIFGKICKICR